MPSILEEVQPSWMQDGLGIVGEQSQDDFDDDTEWDLMVWSKDKQQQEDFIKACCPTGCPCGLTLTFSDVEIPGCCFQYSGSTIPTVLTGSGSDGSFNDTPIAINVRELSSDNCNGCFGWLGIDGFGPALNTFAYWTLSDCTGLLINSGDEVNEWYVALVDGVWYVLAWDFSHSAVLFSGSTTDISNPITNDCMACAHDPTFTVTNPIIQCFFPASGGSVPVCVAAFNGTVLLELNVPCGCCVLNGQCSIRSENECLSLAGEWSEGDCTDICGPCCYFGDCYYDIESDCTPYGGEWFGPAPNDCDTRVCE